jgi:glucose-6-phosphate isomerase
MSSNKFEAKFAGIRFDSAGAFLPGGLRRDELVAFGPRLEAVRPNVIGEVEALRATGVGGAGQGGAGAVVELPERILADYQANRRSSELGRILAAAKRMREAVDRVVIVGSERDCAAARALFGACCHPYHNEQGRGDRGGRPRIYFAPSGFDNDGLQGLLDLLPHDRKPATVDERWGIVVIDTGSEQRSIGNAEDAEDTEKQGMAMRLRVLLAALRRACGGDGGSAARLVVPVMAKRGAAELSEAIKCPEVFELPSGAGGPAAVFSAAGLLPASVMGLDIVRLLEGAAAMNERFRAAPIGDNPPLDFAAIGALVRQRGSGALRRFVGRGRAGEAIAQWCRDLLANSDLRFEISEGKLKTSELGVNLILESVRRDRIAIESDGSESDPLARLVGKTLPEQDADAIETMKRAATAAGRPSVDFHLRALDESSLGQLFQTLILATVMEFRF